MIKKRQLIVISWIFFPLTLYLGINSLITLERGSRVSTIISAIVEARRKSEKVYPSPGRGRLGEFVGRLDKIDDASAPEDFRAAFESYRAAFRNSENDVKAGNFTNDDEGKVEAAYHHMEAVAAKYRF